MTLSGYVGGIIGLAKDAFRFCFALLKRPHYVVLLILFIVGIFYLFGITPQEIPQAVGQQWQAFIDNRKQVVSEELQAFSERIGDDNNPLVQTIAGVSKNLKEETPAVRPMTKELFADPEQVKKEQIFLNQIVAEKKVPDLPEDRNQNVVQGTLFVEGAMQVSIQDQKFKLKVRMRSGKAGAAYAQLKHRFNGVKAKCYPDTDKPEYAECFVGSLSVSEMLIDFGYAEALN